MPPLEATKPVKFAPARGHRATLIVIGMLVGVTVIARSRGYKVGWRTVVRCRRDHLFTTLWIPGVKLKALDLGIARVQYCPVGRHVSLVMPVREADLSDEERRVARSRRGLPLP